MRLVDIFEGAPMDKPRPQKTLWFNDYPAWVQDIKLRFPSAEAHHEEENNEIIALDPAKKDCYGVWQSNKKRGVSYAAARPLHAAIHPRTTIKKLEA